MGALPAGLLQSREAYADLLGEFGDIDLLEARTALQEPLLDLWTRRYSRAVPHRPLLQAFTARGVTYLFDMAGHYDENLESRVVGVVALSQEILPLGALLARLRHERDTHASSDATLALIEATLATVIDALPIRKRHAFARAMREALNPASLPITVLVNDAIARNTGASTSAANLAVLSQMQALLLEGVPPEARLAGVVIPAGATIITAEMVEPLRSVAVEAEARLSSPERGSLAARLFDVHPGTQAFSFLDRRLRVAPTDDFLDRILQYLGPVIPPEDPRPRGARQRRHNALHLKARGLSRPLDVGHFAAHASGGPSDMNVFPQDRALNRGWSDEGRVYRWMERYVASHPRTFYFSRPVYLDATSVPKYLEYGILMNGDELKTIQRETKNPLERLAIVKANPKHPTRIAILLGVFDNDPKS